MRLLFGTASAVQFFERVSTLLLAIIKVRQDEWDAALCVVLELKRKKMLAAEGDVLRGGERGGGERRPPRPDSRPRLEAMLVGQASPEVKDSVPGSTSPVLRPGVCC